MRYDFIAIETGIKHILNFTPQNFIEIGSRDGHDTKTMQQIFNISPSNCYIFEAHPELFRNIENQYPEFNTYNCALSDKTEPIIFNAADLKNEVNPGASSVLEAIDENFKSNKVEVDGWRMDDISKNLNINNIDLVKIDVEGFSLQVLKGFGDLLNNTKCIQIELEHKECWKKQSNYDEVKSFLNKNNFTEIIHIRMVHDQSDSLWVKNNLIDPYVNSNSKS
tara:strand:+ start:4863 stop:5528 length:666 start_codon:yes stop_codon:yes gene_type:complete